MKPTRRIYMLSIFGLFLFTVVFVGIVLLKSNRAWETLCVIAGIHREKGVILFGDSLMAQISMALNFGWSPYKNRSVPGRRAISAVPEFKKVLPEATYIVLLLGTNDLGTGVSQEEFVGAMERLGQMAQATGCGVAVCSILPVSGAHLTTRSPEVLSSVNGMLQQMCIRNDFEFLNIYPLFADGSGYLDTHLSTDGLHLNWKGRYLLGAAVKRRVELVSNGFYGAGQVCEDQRL